MLSFGSRECRMQAAKTEYYYGGSRVILGNKCIHALKNQGFEP